MPVVKPVVKPARPWFSSGPTAKRPGYKLAGLSEALHGRGIRAPETTARFAYGLKLTREVLGVPDDYVMVFTPGSDTGAVEAALWGMLGPKPVTVVAFENFGLTWAEDVRDHLKLDPVVVKAPWGDLPDLSVVDWSHDVVFPWNGTTSGVKVPDGDWIAADREGLSICDATSAAFAQPLDWAKLDVTTFSFQKALGGEAGIGVMVMSPRAVARLDENVPAWPVPKVLRLTGKDGKFDRTLAEGVVINTASVLTMEDWIDALEWAKSVGGCEALIARTDANYAALEAWVQKTAWVDFLPQREDIRSTTSVCLKFTDDRVSALDDKGQKTFVKRFKALLEDEGAVYDMEPHRNAPPGLRLWCGCTVETADVVAIGPWLEWAFATAVAEI
ncbi:phosphoserine transaminase [Brevundimonas terrae]|uniref:phosphoserine transaminase n=1 Tax=Brevundimonas terrae TaxID=363631 RepID=A0ABN0YB74_9CAUL|nr:phosphoserine transaminase [Brevundimonas terrae]NIJ26258.1 phosphoserine aminotransferase [Brevundimonas terrae]